MTGVLRSCAAGGGHHLGYMSKSFNGAYYCPRHLKDLMSSFDPKPNSTVCFIDFPPGEYVVLARDEDVVEVRKLGRPDLPSSRVRICGLYPGLGEHINFRRGCGGES